eukprot:4018792-Amphidinium_carterae.1
MERHARICRRQQQRQLKRTWSSSRLQKGFEKRLSPSRATSWIGPSKLSKGNSMPRHAVQLRGRCHHPALACPFRGRPHPPPSCPCA